MPAIHEQAAPSGKAFHPSRPNPALFTDPQHEIHMEESPALEPKPDECVVHMRANGICGFVLVVDDLEQALTFLQVRYTLLEAWPDWSSPGHWQSHPWA